MVHGADLDDVVGVVHVRFAHAVPAAERDTTPVTTLMQPVVAVPESRALDDILVDQGLGDPFLTAQLKPELLEQACREAGQKLTLRLRDGYDHSYFFMASFIADHIAWHARRLA